MRSSVFFSHFENNYSAGYARCKICSKEIDINRRAIHMFYSHHRIYEEVLEMVI